MKKAILIIAVFAIGAGAAFLGYRYFNAKNGTNVPQNNQNQKSGNPEIIVNSPLPSQTVSSPIFIEGEAKGNWYFEASFPIKLFDAGGNQLGTAIARANPPAGGDWMTTDFVPFKAELNYNLSATSTGALVFRNDNPSGLPEKGKEFRVPVVISPSNIMPVNVYFNNSNLDPEVSCNKAFPVERIIPKTPAVARAALEELLKGPTEQEKAGGFFTSINPGVKIQKLTIKNSVAKVDFDETLEKAVGGSCRVSAIRAQIVETLKQFPGAKDVVISINGRTEDILQP